MTMAAMTGRALVASLLTGALLALLALLSLLSLAACVPSDSAHRDGLDPAAVAALVNERTNDLRRYAGLDAVAVAPPLEQAARYFADYMARTERYSHTADGSEPAARARDHGYDLCIVSENIAYHFSERGFSQEALAQQIVQSWADSPGHRENMLDPAVTETGTAVAQSTRSGRHYAVQMFGRPQSAVIRFSIANAAQRGIGYRLADRHFTLEPGQARTHEVCRSPALVLDGEAAPQQTHPQSEDRLAVVDRQGRLHIEQR